MRELGFCPRPVNSRPPGPLAAAECIGAGECGCDIGNPVPWLEFELPAPPSVNRFMAKLGNKTPAVVKWAKQADLAFLASRHVVKLCRIKGKFEAEYIFGQHPGDLSNRIKPLEDWLQSREFIENDRLCQSYRCAWDWYGVPTGRVNVRLRQWMAS